MIRSRYQILIDLDESHEDILIHEQSARFNGVCMFNITNTIAKYMSGGIRAVTEYKRSIHSDNARRKPNGCAKVRITMLYEKYIFLFQILGFFYREDYYIKLL